MTTNPIRVLHVFSSFGIGGLETRMAEILNCLGSAYRHYIIALDGNIACQDRLSTDLRVAILPDRRVSRNPLKQIASARATLVRLRPDLLVTYNWGAVDWAMGNRIQPICPHIHMEGGFGIEEARGQLLRRVLYRRVALRRTKWVIVPSRQLEKLALTTWKLRPGQVHYIANGVDCARFGRAMGPYSTASGPQDENEVVVGTVAALRPEKNLALLLRSSAALSRKHALRLVIVGDGAERPQLTALAEKLGISKITKFVGQTDLVEQYLRGFDIFALTSVTEQMPSSILQAMAAAKPVAAVRVGDVEYMLAPANRALLSEPQDEDAFTETLKRLASDADLRHQIGTENRAFVEINFPLDATLAAYRAVFREAAPAPLTAETTCEL